MKRFGAPHMTLVHLVNDDVICTSGGCVANYCDGYTCPVCQDQDNCDVQTPCAGYNCKGEQKK